MEPSWLLHLLHRVSVASFYLLAGIALLGALGVVLARNLFRAALCLGLALLGVAGLYLYLAAEFLAVVQLLIYVGAILVLLIFGVMLTARIADPTIPQFNRQIVPATLVASGTAWVLLAALRKTAGLPTRPTTFVPLADLGVGFVTTYVLPFEVLSLILVAALVGAVVVARRDS